MRGAPRLPAMDAVLTMAASSDLRSALTAACVIRNTPLVLTAKMRSHRSAENSSMAPLSTTPALLTSTSRPPKAISVSSTATAQDAALVTSRGVHLQPSSSAVALSSDSVASA